MLRKMIKITGIFLAILLLTFSFTMNSQEISADPMKEKDKPHVKKMKVVDEGFTITNDWFKKKKNDVNRQIDPFTNFETFFELPETGDDMIQKNPINKKGSLKYNENPIIELGGQPGWEGSFEFKGNPGEYDMNFFLPLTEPTSKGDSYNLTAVLSVPITISP